MGAAKKHREGERPSAPRAGWLLWLGAPCLLVLLSMLPLGERAQVSAVLPQREAALPVAVVWGSLCGAVLCVGVLTMSLRRWRRRRTVLSAAQHRH